MSDAILVLNAGSSSLKFALFLLGSDSLQRWLDGAVTGIGTSPGFSARDTSGAVVREHQWGETTAFDQDDAVEYLMCILPNELGGHRLVAVGHRVVHGGLEYSAPVRIDAQVIERLESFIPLAPLHQPHNLAPMRRLLASHPRLPQVACFDTAFHRTQPEVAQAFALPADITSQGVRRYGFHGLSYEYIASVLPHCDQRAATGRTIVLHLGSGASGCALRAGQSIATSMGMTGVDGLPMGTRSGNLDPGVILHLMDAFGMDARAIEDVIYNRSGLLGVSGISGDMRALLASRDPRAGFAIDLFVYRVVREVGSLAAALGGLDTVVFTGGIGEHAAPIRERICHALRWLGLELDAAENARAGPCVSTVGSRVSAWVIPTNEAGVIAGHVARLIRQA